MTCRSWTATRACGRWSWPATATALDNHWGTAPGFALPLGSAVEGRDPCTLFALPGREGAPLFVSVLAYLIFGQVPDIYVWIGGSMIFASIAFITYREHQLRQKSKLLRKLAEQA